MIYGHDEAISDAVKAGRVRPTPLTSKLLKPESRPPICGKRDLSVELLFECEQYLRLPVGLRSKAVLE